MTTKIKLEMIYDQCNKLVQHINDAKIGTTGQLEIDLDAAAGAVYAAAILSSDAIMQFELWRSK